MTIRTHFNRTWNPDEPQWKVRDWLQRMEIHLSLVWQRRLWFGLQGLLYGASLLVTITTLTPIVTPDFYLEIGFDMALPGVVIYASASVLGLISVLGQYRAFDRLSTGYEYAASAWFLRVMGCWQLLLVILPSFIWYFESTRGMLALAILWSLAAAMTYARGWLHDY